MHSDRAVDAIQERLAGYACGLHYDSLTPAPIHAAKVRIIDTLGALVGGYFGEPCRIARSLAARMPAPGGATVLGARMKTTPHFAAFVNATSARYAELNDVHLPGSGGGHPSDVVTPLFAAAEHAQSSGREFITAIVLAYEVYLRVVEATRMPGFDSGNFVCLAAAVGAGKLLRLTPPQLSSCISIALVANNALRVGRVGHLTMWKTAAAGQAGGAGVFAAILARAGMEGPDLPFEGTGAWCDHVAHGRFSLDTMGGNAIPFKIEQTLIKLRPCCAATISPLLAAEKIAASVGTIRNVQQVTVEVGEKAKVGMGTGAHHWRPDSRETADHSIPYVTAAALMDGTVTPRSFDDAHLSNPLLRALMEKITVVSNDDFTRAYEQQQRSRITVLTTDGERYTGESWGGSGDLSAQPSDAQIGEKFSNLAEEYLGPKRVDAILDRLWHLEDENNIAALPPAFVLG